MAGRFILFWNGARLCGQNNYSAIKQFALRQERAKERAAGPVQFGAKLMDSHTY